MQTIQSPWGVVTHGTASVKAKPDLARIRFQVTQLEQTPAEAFAATSAAVRAVRQVLREHGIPDEAVEESQLRITSEWNYGEKRTLVGYQGRGSFVVETGDLDDVPQLLVDLVAAGVNEIDGVDFDVAAKDDLLAEARRQAVDAAQRKAEQYAEAAGVRLGPVVHIDDTQPEQIPLERSYALSAAGGATAADLTPGHVVVHAAVVVGFAIETG